MYLPCFLNKDDDDDDDDDEYPPPTAPLGLNCYQGLLTKMTTILVFQQYSVGLNYMYTVLLLRRF